MNTKTVGGQLTLPRHWGIYAATVHNNSDPLGHGRVKLRIPQIMGTAISNWANPVANNGIVPVYGQKVFAMFTGGDVNYPLYFLPEPINTGLSSTVVQLFGALGTFGPVTNWITSPSGHSFIATPVPNWLFGPGEAPFYTEVMSDGQVIISTVELSENELIPTFDHAELNIFDPARFKFYTQVIPTSTGALKAITPGKSTGGTDAGGGDLRKIVNGGTELLVFSCGGYYFNWDIGVTGLYPVIGFLNRNSDGDWIYNQGISKTTTQLHDTNPSVWEANITPTISTGLDGTYWYARAAGQMAVLPQSGNIVLGHYFNRISGPNTGAISVISPSGNLLATYQIPNITPPSGTLSTGAVRDVEADPSSVLNDERFVILYDGFGTGIAAHPFQEFSYNQSTKTITPMSTPCITNDTNTNQGFSIIDSQGTLFVTTNIGLGAGNTSVYVKNAGTGNRSYVTNFPASPGWQTGPNSWGALAAPDYSVAAPRQQGLGIFDGPMSVDPVTGAILHPGASGHLGFVIPNYPLALGANLLSTADSGFETVNILSADDATFATSLGDWGIFVGIISRVTPPVPPPFGTSAAQLQEAFGACLALTGHLTGIIPNHTYQFTTYFLTQTTGRSCEAWVRWFDGSGNTLFDSSHTVITDNPTAWTACNILSTAPSNAASVALLVQIDGSGAGELHYFASNFLWDMTIADWSGFFNIVQRVQGISHSGNFSMELSAQFTPETISALGPRFNVIPNQEYQATAWFLAATVSSSNCQILLRFFDINSIEIVQASSTLSITDNTSTWVQARTSGLTPVNAATCQIILEVDTQHAGETHYVDDIFFQTQPFTSVPFVDLGITALRALYPNMGLGRGCISNRRYYIPLANTSLTAAESSALNNGTYVPAPKPQFLISVDLPKVLSR